MRIAVIGAGAIGGYVGAALCKADYDVTLVARNAHLRAMRDRGLTVRSERGSYTVAPKVTDRIETVGQVDVVILAVKAHQIVPILPDLEKLLHDDTAIVTMQNGIPWWYFQAHGGAFDDTVLQSVDPDGLISKAIDPKRIVGSVIYCSTEIVAPGVIDHMEGTRFSLGEPDRVPKARTQAIADAFVKGGLKAPVESDVRKDIWIKLLGNACFNPISALTRATLVDMATDPGVEPLARGMMEESLAVANALGVDIGITVEKRMDGARRVGAHKTSMLQDLEANRPFELDCITGAVVEMAALVGVEVPLTRHVYGLTKLLEQKTFAQPPRAVASAFGRVA